MQTKNKRQVRKVLLAGLILLICGFLTAQNTKPVLAVFNIESSISISSKNLGDITRIEAGKLNEYDVLDPFDLLDVLDQNEIDLDNCYSKECLVKVGKLVNADKVLCGTTKNLGEAIVVTLRIVDIKTNRTEQSIVKEFLFLPASIKDMIHISLREMHNLENDMELVKKLTKKYTYENSVNTPESYRLRSDGPRMGASLYTGELASILNSPKSQGGYDAIPVMFQIGYQFEVKYLNEGNFQALFEFIPTVTGLDQGLFIPGITIMNGLRSNKNGWEFAFGPTIGLVKTASGYYLDNEWHLKRDWEGPGECPYATEHRLDSRGSYNVNTGFVFALGKTFRSGSLNIPVNTFVVPGRDGFKAGVSFGYNSRKKH